MSAAVSCLGGELAEVGGRSRVGALAAWLGLLGLLGLLLPRVVVIVVVIKAGGGAGVSRS